MNDTPILANIVATSSSTSTLISSTSTVNVLRTKRSKNQKYFWNSLMHRDYRNINSIALITKNRLLLY